MKYIEDHFHANTPFSWSKCKRTGFVKRNMVKSLFCVDNSNRQIGKVALGKQRANNVLKYLYLGNGNISWRMFYLRFLVDGTWMFVWIVHWVVTLAHNWSIPTLGSISIWSMCWHKVGQNFLLKGNVMSHDHCGADTYTIPLLVPQVRYKNNHASNISYWYLNHENLILECIAYLLDF